MHWVSHELHTLWLSQSYTLGISQASHAGPLTSYIAHKLRTVCISQATCYAYLTSYMLCISHKLHAMRISQATCYAYLTSYMLCVSNKLHAMRISQRTYCAYFTTYILCVFHKLHAVGRCAEQNLPYMARCCWRYRQHWHIYNRLYDHCTQINITNTVYDHLILNSCKKRQLWLQFPWLRIKYNILIIYFEYLCPIRFSLNYLTKCIFAPK